VLSVAWIAGVISTSEYVRLKRQREYGCEAAYVVEASLRHSDRLLLENRIAVVVFLIGFLLLAYTFVNSPSANYPVPFALNLNKSYGAGRR